MEHLRDQVKTGALTTTIKEKTKRERRASKTGTSDGGWDEKGKIVIRERERARESERERRHRDQDQDQARPGPTRVKPPTRNANH